jgi:glycosyltransferase 2 family protein
LSGKKNFRQILRWLPGVIISLVAAYFIARFIEVDDLVQAMRTFTALDITVVIGLDILSFVTRALGWKNLLEGISFKQAFLIINEGYLFNNLIPRSGEVARTLLVSGVSGISAFQVASSVLVERALDIVIAASMFLLTLPLAVEMAWVKPIALVLFIGFLCMLIILVILALKSDQVKSWMASSRIHSELVKEKIFPKFASVLDGLAVLKQPAKFARSMFWIIMSWVCWTSLIYFGLSKVAGTVPVWWAIFAQGMLALGIALPSAPAGLGVYEGTMVAALAVFGIDESASLSIALLLHLTQILITAVIGIYGLLAQGQSITKMFDRIWTRNTGSGDPSTGES